MKEENWTNNHVPQSQPQKDQIHPCSTANLLYLGGGPVKKEKKGTQNLARQYTNN